jgi:tRNA pseudouridine38-40 synthase
VPKALLIVEYNGAGFHGWQVQPKLRTVQSELQRVIETIVRQSVPALEASGRTDSGVHARGQVVCVRLPEMINLDVFRRSISALLPRELTVHAARWVDEDFDPCRHAKRKQYSYHILHRDVPAVLEYGRVWYVPWRLDRERLERDARALIGEHDFESFRCSGCEAATTVRTIYESTVSINGDSIVYRVIGSGFLKQMVRTIVGTLVDCASERIVDRTIVQILEAKDRRRAGVTAPAHGLYLDWVSYE